MGKSITDLSFVTIVGLDLAKHVFQVHGVDATGRVVVAKAVRRNKLLAQSSETTAAERQLGLSLQQARYEAAHARRQYDAVDPANRLVAGELERRWNEALQAIARIEGDIAAMIARRPPPLGEPERQQLLALGADLERAWSHPAATPAIRKRILRTAISEVIVRRDGAILHAVLHWQGGDHTELPGEAAAECSRSA